MKLLNYENYITESILCEFLLESKIVYSKEFIDILNKIKDDKIANEILNLYSKNVEKVTLNYIDITDKKDEVSFTPDRKSSEILKENENVYKVIKTGKCLTKSSRNDNIFEKLGYDKEKYECWSIPLNTEGIILSEAISTTGKIYVMFKEKNGERIGVINKMALHKNIDDSKIWTTSRNPIRIGRFVRALLNNVGINYSDYDIETFVNKYKSSYDFYKNELKQFDIVSGDDIAYWYNYKRYVDGNGSLNNSCMGNVYKNYFDIYTRNKNVRMVILYDDNGDINTEKYKSDKIKGRAILWTCKIDGEDAIFMDRIYTVNDSDVELFKQLARANNWWYKSWQSMEPDEEITNEKKRDYFRIDVKLENCYFDYYPYLDTMCYLKTDESILTNADETPYWYLKNTDGSYEEYDS